MPSCLEVYMALANGGCLIQTPAALVEVDNATDAKEVFKGKAMMNWQLLHRYGAPISGAAAALP